MVVVCSCGGGDHLAPLVNIFWVQYHVVTSTLLPHVDFSLIVDPWQWIKGGGVFLNFHNPTIQWIFEQLSFMNVLILANTNLTLEIMGWASRMLAIAWFLEAILIDES